MKKIIPFIILLTLLSCGGDFEPKITGWQAYTHPSRQIYLKMNGKEKYIQLPGGDNIGYRFAQWAKFQDHILVTQVTKTKICDNYQLVEVDTLGNIIDTIYTAPPNTALNFKLSPNDSLLLLKTYFDNCEWDQNYCYTFYNRYTKTALPDSIKVGSSRGILLNETIWSPDSRKVILSEWSGGLVSGFVYDLITKDTIDVDIGENFTWSPTDTNLVAYIKDYSLYTKNIKTGEEDVVYKGREKKGVVDFRWNPTGDFLMIHIASYLLNLEANPFRRTTVLYISMKDKSESRTFYEDHGIDTWKEKNQNANHKTQ